VAAHAPAPTRTEAASPPTISRQIAALRQALENARRIKRNADGALNQATYNLENARGTKSGADSALKQARNYYSEIVAWARGVSVIGPNGNQIAADVGRRLNEASRAIPPAQMRVAMADQAVAQAEGALSAAQTQAAQAAAQVQSEERRQQILAKLGVHCEDPQTAEETRQCESDYFKANFGSSQANFRADLGSELSKRYDDLRAAEELGHERARIEAQAQAHAQVEAEAQRGYEAERARIQAQAAAPPSTAVQNAMVAPPPVATGPTVTRQSAPIKTSAATEQAFIDAIEKARAEFRDGTNEMAKGASRAHRAEALCDLFANNFTVSNWTGTVAQLSSNSDGKGVLAITLAPDITVRTSNNSFSDLFDHTLIEPTSSVYNQAVALRNGQHVTFSGTFTVAEGVAPLADCIHEVSLTQYGSMTKPEFFFRFSAISWQP
jgi:hypothetical protein